MPRFDVECAPCGTVTEVVAHWSDRAVPCATCGHPTERVWITPPAAIQDTLNGGAQWIENLDKTPVWVESKTQLRREAAARGLNWDPRGPKRRVEDSMQGRYNGGRFPSFREQIRRG